VDFLWFVALFGVLAFLVGFLLTVTLGSSPRGVAAVAAAGLLVVGTLVGVSIAFAPSEPVHESVESFGRHVSPYLWFYAALNLLGWSTGVAAGWAARQAGRSRRGAQLGQR
jgi:hypothetical protein